MTPRVRLTLQGFTVSASLASDARRLYYAINEIYVYASCDCNAKATACDTSSLPYTCACDAATYTTGRQVCISCS